MPQLPDSTMLGTGAVLLVVVLWVLIRMRPSNAEPEDLDRLEDAPLRLPPPVDDTPRCLLCNAAPTHAMPRSSLSGLAYAWAWLTDGLPAVLCERDAATYRGLLQIDIDRNRTKASEQKAERDRWLADREGGGILDDARALRTPKRKPQGSVHDLTEGIV